MADSLRLRMLLYIQSMFKAVDKNQPPDDPYPFAITTVGVGPLGDPDSRKLATIGIVAGDETKGDLYPYRDCVLPVAIEWRFTVNQGDSNPGIMAERMLTVVQRVMNQDRTLGGLAVDCRETRNHIDLDTYGDRTPTGVVFYDIQYRHAEYDPRSAQGE